MLTPEKFRDSIKNLLNSELGFYTLPNGITTPAILLIQPGQLAPNNNCSGLEVIINYQCDRSTKTAFGSIDVVNEWTVFLVQWDGPLTMLEAEEKILRQYLNARSRPQPVPENKGCLSQCVVKIPEYDT